MTDIEISILTLLAKGMFFFISALCIAEMLKGAMAGKGWHSARPLLTWLAWILVTWLLGFLLFMLANAHTHIPAKIMVIRLIALGYLFLGATLVVYLVKRLPAGNSPEAG